MKLKLYYHDVENPENTKKDEYEIRLTNDEWYELIRTVDQSFYLKIQEARKHAKIKWVND